MGPGARLEALCDAVVGEFAAAGLLQPQASGGRGTRGVAREEARAACIRLDEAADVACGGHTA
jgi:hypothetical protein